jgi:hypothetical protein
MKLSTMVKEYENDVEDVVICVIEENAEDGRKGNMNWYCVQQTLCWVLGRMMHLYIYNSTVGNKKYIIAH